MIVCVIFLPLLRGPVNLCRTVRVFARSHSAQTQHTHTHTLSLSLCCFLSSFSLHMKAARSSRLLSHVSFVCARAGTTSEQSPARAARYPYPCQSSRVEYSRQRAHPRPLETRFASPSPHPQLHARYAVDAIDSLLDTRYSLLGTRHEKYRDDVC